MGKFLITEEEKSNILGMYFKPIINEQAMLNFGGVFQALPFEQWRNTPEVESQRKQGMYRDQSAWNTAYNNYVISKYNEVTPFVQNDPSSLIGKTIIVWNNVTEGTLKPSDVLKSFPIASVYCGNVYKGNNYGEDIVINKSIYFFTQVQTVGDLIWDENHSQSQDNKKTNIIPTFVGGPQLQFPDLYVPNNNPILGLKVVRPNGAYYVLNTKTMQILENGTTNIGGTMYISSNTYQPGQYAGLQMPQFSIEKLAVDPKNKRRQ